MPSEFYTVEELADKLKVSEQTIRLWIRQGKLESYQFGRAHRIPAESFERFLEQSKPQRAHGEDDEEIVSPALALA